MSDQPVHVVAVRDVRFVGGGAVAASVALSTGEELEVCETATFGSEGVCFAAEDEWPPMSDAACLLRAKLPGADWRTVAALSGEILSALRDGLGAFA